MPPRPHRTLRYNLDVEASILGGVLVRNELLAQLDTLEVDDFYALPHKVVFEAMRNLEAAGKPIDVVMLEAAIERAGKLDAVGGVAFLGELALRVPTADNVLEYARIVQQLAMTRRLALVAGEIVERCYDVAQEPEELLERAMTLLARVDRAKPDRGAMVGELAKRRFGEIVDMLERRGRGETALTGVPTGIEVLDRKIGGWQFGIVNMIAARPAMGKSAAAIATADAASKAGFGVHVFCLEDSWRTYTDRLLSRQSGVAAERIRQGELEQRRDGMTDFSHLGHAVTNLGYRAQWYVDDRKGLSVSEIVRSVRRMKKQLGTRLVVVDYVHLVRRDPRLEENAAIDQIMTALAAAVEPDEAWLVLSQLNRKIEDRNDKRPQLADLRGSGALEERAKMIVGLYRGSYYGGDPKRHVDYDCDCDDTKIREKRCTHAPSAEDWEKQAQAIVIKNSNGAPGRVFASWRATTTEIW